MYSYEKCPEDVKKLIDDIVESFKKTLKDNLVGIYLHGSLAMGCFNPDYSDIDMLVVVERKMSVRDKERFIKDFLDTIRGRKLPEKGIEFSVIQIGNLENFELHYSKMWEKAYEQNDIDFSKQNRDPDLAAHILVVLKRGIRLHGKPVKEVFKPIPERFYVESILYDAEDIRRDPMEDPVYSILNLCRVLYYLKEKVISSKREAGYWAIEMLPENFKGMIEKALAVYEGKISGVEWDEKEVREFVEHVFSLIERDLSTS